MSDTPRCDEHFGVPTYPDAEHPDVKFARQLERELAQAKASLATFHRGWEEQRDATARQGLRADSAEARVAELEARLEAAETFIRDRWGSSDYFDSFGGHE